MVTLLAPSKTAQLLVTRFELLKDDGRYLSVSREVAKAAAIETANILRETTGENDYWDAVLNELAGYRPYKITKTLGTEPGDITLQA